MTTLEEAVALGRGVERPFRCHAHDDTSASASVNVVKMVWYCYACHAKGVVDGNRVPTLDELEAMLEPEKACREYADSFLTVYGHGGYWSDRFPLWVCWAMGMGEDPWTGDGVFPVHTPRGRLAGLGRRFVMPGPGPKYKYPATWSASRTLFGSRGVWRPEPYLVLVEGAADAVAVRQAGIPAYAVYGSGVHAPQVELIAQMNPGLILAGFDMDEAGERAVAQAAESLFHLAPIARVVWDGYKDPAEMPWEERQEAVLRTVSATGYGPVEDVARLADNTIGRLQRLYLEENDG